MRVRVVRAHGELCLLSVNAEVSREIAMNKLNRRGFTLIEMTIVGIFLGLLTLFVVNSFSQKATASLQAKSLQKGLDALLTSHELFLGSCGHLLKFQASNVEAGNFGAQATSYQNWAYNNLSVLAGVKPLNSRLETCYKDSGLKPLTGLVGTTKPVPVSRMYAAYSSGAYSMFSIGGVPVYASYVLGGTGSRPQMLTLYADLPEDVALHFLNNLGRGEPYVSVADMRAKIAGSTPTPNPAYKSFDVYTNASEPGKVFVMINSRNYL